jgi:hypothetical protein
MKKKVQLPRMTMRRWMAVVALTCFMTTAGMAWHRRAYYRQQAAIHSRMELKATVLALSLEPRPPVDFETSLRNAVSRDLASIERARRNPRSLMAVGGPVALASFPRLRPQDMTSQIRRIEAELRQVKESLESLRKNAEAQAVYHGRIRMKYEKAALHPLLPILPDSPPP